MGMIEMMATWYSDYEATAVFTHLQLFCPVQQHKILGFFFQPVDSSELAKFQTNFYFSEDSVDRQIDSTFIASISFCVHVEVLHSVSHYVSQFFKGEFHLQCFCTDV